MIKHRKDSDALLEAFHRVQLDEDDKTPYDGHDEDDKDKKSDEEEDVQKESVARSPESEIDMAIGRVNGGDWEGAIERVMAALGNYIKDSVNEDDYGGSPLENPDTAKNWCLKTGIEDAVTDLLGGANASIYEELKRGFQQAFHRGNQKDEDLSRFFDGEPPMQEVHRNHEEPSIDPYDMLDR
jgi:hypothetical protein